MDFSSKQQARKRVWDILEEQMLARAPLPPHNRIPNFKDSRQAAERLFDHAPWRDARRIKVNPDSPQRHVRELALQRGIQVYVPTPRLTGSFHLLDPANIAPAEYASAARRQTMHRFSTSVPLAEMPQLDAIVTGCVAVTTTGKRCGKGAGYSDLEFAILIELGHTPVPVATTVHDAQLVGDFPCARFDLPLSLICTPSRSIGVQRLTAEAAGAAGASGIDWARLDEADLRTMPILMELRELQRLRGEGKHPR